MQGRKGFPGDAGGSKGLDNRFDAGDASSEECARNSARSEKKT
jgi:hypothetical protein